MSNNALDAAATELEDLIKSHEPEKKEASIADELMKSAAMDEEPEEDEEDEEDEEKPVEKSYAGADEVRKSLADSEEYQQAYDVSDVIGVLGDAMVKGFTGLDERYRGTHAQIARLEKRLGLVMRGLASVLKQQEERTPVRKPMTGHFGGMQKSQAPLGTSEKLPFSVKQLDRAATILLEQQKLPVGSGARIEARGVEAFYKSLSAEKQELFANVIGTENIAA